jgi:hypothetical protein
MKPLIALALLLSSFRLAAQAQSSAPGPSNPAADAVGGVVQDKTQRQTDRIEYKTESAADRATDRAVDKVLDKALLRVFGS